MKKKIEETGESDMEKNSPDSDSEPDPELFPDDFSVHGFNKGIRTPHGLRDISEEYLETVKDEIGEVIVVRSSTGTHVFKRRSR